MAPPQAFVSGFAPRLRGYVNSLLTPVIPPSSTQNIPASRTTKRGTVVINYSEDLLGDEDFDEGEGPRRHASLRNRNQVDQNANRDALIEKPSREATSPVEIQGIWREWMGKPKFGKYVNTKLSSSASLTSRNRTDKQLHAQSLLPLTLIPIRIDLDIPSFLPHAALPLPMEPQSYGINPTLAAYRHPDPTPAFRLKDHFLWNLHETLITPEIFALSLVNELDLPNHNALAVQIGGQIRQQLEEYAGVALHPLFHSTNSSQQNGVLTKPTQTAFSRDQSQTPAGPSTPGPGGLNGFLGPSVSTVLARAGNSIAAAATPMPVGPPDIDNPDDAYRCIITLNINLLNKLYTDKFEWSLLHPPGAAEDFASHTCADLGLTGEWIPAIAHAIYEAVLRLKKEACESGGLVGGGEIDNLALEGWESGWRYDPESLADEWEPKVEMLSKEEIEKREGDRERQIRRLRRETARFSSTTNLNVGTPTPGYFDQPDLSETPMGRGERIKKKRKLNMFGREDTPGDTGASDAGYGGSGGGAPTEWYVGAELTIYDVLMERREKQSWRCHHCYIHGSAVWSIRDGPAGPRVSSFLSLLY